MSAASFGEIKFVRLRCLTSQVLQRNSAVTHVWEYETFRSDRLRFSRIEKTRKDGAIDLYLRAMLIELSCPKEAIRAVISVRFIGFTT